MSKIERVERADKIIQSVARSYKRSCWWADVFDLVQEGWAWLLESNAKNPDALWSMPDEQFGGYVYTVTAKHLSRYLWGLSCPASASKPGRHLAGMHRAPLEGHDSAGREGGAEEAGTPEQAFLAAEAPAEIERLRDGLRRRIARYFIEYYEDRAEAVRDDKIVAVLLVLVEGVPPKDAAELTALRLEDVYAETSWAKAQARCDYVARRMARELVERRCDHGC